MTRRQTMVVIALVCLALFGVFIFEVEPVEQRIALIKCFFFFPILLLVPGFFIYRSLLRNIPLPVAMLPGVFFSLGLMLYLPITLCAYVFRIQIATYSWLCVAFAILTVIISLWVGKRRHGKKRGIFTTRRDLLFFSIVLVLAAIIALLSLAKGTFLVGGDLWLHMSIIKKFFTRGVIGPESPLFIDGGFDSNYSYCLWHPLLAVVTYFSRLEVTDVWFNAPQVISIIALLTWYGFAQFLFRNHFAALVAFLLMLYDMLFGGFFLQGITVVQYPYSVAPIIVLPVAWVFIIEYVRKGRWALLAGAIGGCVALLFFHKIGFFGFVFHICLFVCCLMIVSPRRKKLIGKAIVLVTAVMAIALVYAAVILPGGTASPYYKSKTEDEVNRLGGRLAIVKLQIPLTRAGVIVAHRRFSIAPMIALILFPYVILRLCGRRAHIERRPASLFVFSGMLILPLVMLNPIAGGVIVERFSPEALVRLYHSLPHYLVIGFVISHVYLISIRYIRQRRGNVWRLIAHNATYASALLVLLASVILYYPKIASGMAGKEFSFYRWKKESLLFAFLKKLDQYDAQPSVVMADYAKSYFIPALTKHYVTLVPYALTSPSMTDSHERRLDLVEFTRERNPERAAAILKKYNARYVVIAEKKDYVGLESYLDGSNLPRMKLLKMFSSTNIIAYKVLEQ